VFVEINKGIIKMAGLKVLEAHHYTEKHEWVKVEGDTATIGITDFAQNALGDLVFIDLPKTGKAIKQGNSCGTLESVKAAEEIYAPISGEVIERNEAVIKDPASVNTDAYSSWMIKIKNFNKAELASLLDSAKYKEYISKLG
jgi:glycine cleavage system H protein